MTLSKGSADVDWADLAALFERVGWGHRQPTALCEAFAASKVVRFAHISSGRLVGVCRAVTDGAWYALVVDLVVDPDFQRCGIGRRLLSSVCDDLANVRQVHLLSTKGNEPFYDQMGFERQPLQAFVRLNRPTPARTGGAT